MRRPVFFGRFARYAQSVLHAPFHVRMLVSLLALSSLSACELVAEFDREKIAVDQPLPNLPTGMVPGERPRDAGMDAGGADAGSDDAGLADAGDLLDAGDLDASTQDAGGDAGDDADAGLDAGDADAGGDAGGQEDAAA